MKLMSLTIVASVYALAAVAYGADAPPKPAKVCSITSDSGWRDSIREGDGATVANCKAFMQTAKASNFQIGCMAPDGAITLGAPGGAPPAQNCGW